MARQREIEVEVKAKERTTRLLAHLKQQVSHITPSHPHHPHTLTGVRQGQEVAPAPSGPREG